MATKNNYLYSIGRRKQSIARVRLFKGKGETLVNDQPIANYFPGAVSQKRYLTPLAVCGVADKYYATIKVAGSGKVSQLEAIVLGLARAMVKVDSEKYKPLLKKEGLMTRDPRKKERRKVGTGGKARRKKQSPKR
jgi:small subunit ribosomal protein S9